MWSRVEYAIIFLLIIKSRKFRDKRKLIDVIEFVSRKKQPAVSLFVVPNVFGFQRQIELY